jgi:hypothetical protein
MHLVCLTHWVRAILQQSRSSCRKTLKLRGQCVHAAKLAVIVVHGSARNADDYFCSMLEARNLQRSLPVEQVRWPRCRHRPESVTSRGRGSSIGDRCLARAGFHMCRSSWWPRVSPS